MASPFADVSPALAAITDNVLFGDVWERPGLSPRDRQRAQSDNLVEAAGVEPASENSGSLAPTCLALTCVSSAFCPKSEEQTWTSPNWFS